MNEATSNAEFEFVLNKGVNVVPLPSTLQPYDGPVMLNAKPWVRKPYTQEELITLFEGFFDEVAKQGGTVLSIIDADVANGEFDGPGIDRKPIKLALIQKD